LPATPVSAPPAIERPRAPERLQATAAVKLLEELGIVTELTGQKKNRSFSYAAYVDLLAR
jgi:hypothetical protein